MSPTQATSTGMVEWFHRLYTGAHSLYECSACSSLVNEAGREGHIRWHNTFTSKGRAEAMSKVLWCNPGDHPFNAEAPGAQHISLEADETNSRGETVRVKRDLDACAEHGFQGTASAPPAIAKS